MEKNRQNLFQYGNIPQTIGVNCYRAFVSIMMMLVVIWSLCMPAFAAAPADITATTWILIDGLTGQILTQNLGDHRMYPASTTKILTVAMALEKSQNDLTIPLTVSQQAVSSITWDSSHIALQPGEVVSLGDMVYGAMLASGNDAANVLAEYICGSLENVEEVFSQKLKEIGCQNTNFVNAHGLHDTNHYTTAEDMAKITRWALSVPGFKEVFGAEKYNMPPTNLQPQIRYFSTPDWMRLNGAKYSYPYAMGSKNGWTTEAGHTFASWAEKDGRQLICVLMNSATKYRKFVDAANLYDYGFDHFYPVNLGEVLPTKTVSIQGGGDPLGSAVVQAKPMTFYLEDGYTVEQIRSEIISPDVYTLGQPFEAKVNVWLESVDGTTVPLGEFPMELHGIDTLLSDNVGKVPENLVGSGRVSAFSVKRLWFYAGIVLLIVGLSFSLWKLHKKQFVWLRRSNYIGFLRKERTRWPYASVQAPGVSFWKASYKSKYGKFKPQKDTFVFRSGNQKR